MRISADFNDGVPSESWSSQDIADAVALRDDSSDTFKAHTFAYLAAFQQRRDAEAGRILEICLQHSSRANPLQREATMCNAASFQALRRRRIDLAEQWLADMPQPTNFPWLRAQAAATILQLRDDREGALKQLDLVEKELLAKPDGKQRTDSVQWLERWRSELRSVG